ncbi:hypothetical protein COY52_11400 [Candidatus Desantisbacteria bacterium CG_4_10_14_0_8_um_filter_48_22]|uniref:Uncharacterized protein n=1 Tax=Candidatus Desantisbacteria bacterium CG_4_10_14_0_8_um_filter_48_22 TaxID=1974543 RepID=A0A2M7S599_9BACT|nr:MAG: hypothetical protein COS16_08055 [Candidatus Desantisbacteria bacterium CG02_land_8_20_14_3_00_49_13]PIZ14717.1 MAG: hypothetical protein COY52_11400 [Candidatus Desantisbacteria bacterium CG_4_10_14_0_8_um_filter_48_22]
MVRRKPFGVILPEDFFRLKREKVKEEKVVEINYDISQIDSDWLQQVRKKRLEAESSLIKDNKIKETIWGTVVINLQKMGGLWSLAYVHTVFTGF